MKRKYKKMLRADIALCNEKLQEKNNKDFYMQMYQKYKVFDNDLAIGTKAKVPNGVSEYDYSHEINKLIGALNGYLESGRFTNNKRTENMEIKVNNKNGIIGDNNNYSINKKTDVNTKVEINKSDSNKNGLFGTIISLFKRRK